jgi:hypothetical protein
MLSVMTLYTAGITVLTMPIAIMKVIITMPIITKIMVMAIMMIPHLLGGI